MNIIFDIVLVCVLVVTLLYCVRLSRRVQLVQESKKEMFALCKRLDEIVLRAQDGIKELRNTSEYVGTYLDGALKSAQHQIGEMQALQVSGQEIMQALQQMLEHARNLEKVGREAHIMQNARQALQTRPSSGENFSSGLNLQEKRFALETLLKRVSAKVEKENNIAAAAPPMISVNAPKPSIPAITTTRSQEIKRAESVRASAKERIKDPVEKMLRTLGYGYPTEA